MLLFRNAAAKFGEHEAVQWLQAYACSLPFGDRMFRCLASSLFRTSALSCETSMP